MKKITTIIIVLIALCNSSFAQIVVNPTSKLYLTTVGGQTYYASLQLVNGSLNSDPEQSVSLPKTVTVALQETLKNGELTSKNVALQQKPVIVGNEIRYPHVRGSYYVLKVNRTGHSNENETNLIAMN